MTSERKSAEIRCKGLKRLDRGGLDSKASGYRQLASGALQDERCELPYSGVSHGSGAGLGGVGDDQGCHAPKRVNGTAFPFFLSTSTRRNSDRSKRYSRFSRDAVNLQSKCHPGSKPCLRGSVFAYLFGFWPRRHRTWQSPFRVLEPRKKSEGTDAGQRTWLSIGKKADAFQPERRETPRATSCKFTHSLAIEMIRNGYV